MSCEPFAYRLLAEMAERRIPYVMDETGTFYDSRNISLCLEVERRIQPSVNDGFRNILGKRSADRGDLQTVRKSCPYEIALIQRKDLRLILQPSEGCAADDPVIILLKFAPKIILQMILILSRTVRAEDL